LLILLSLTFAGCGSNRPQDGPPQSGSGTIANLPGDAVPRPEPRSKYGNGPVYEVLGKRYSVMASSGGYKERGVASWYGRKFHGRLTSNREPYDMHAMTAAHKTLPLPTYVRVRNLSNNKSIIVRVNDRGPFVHNRIIDLSYSAALKLDMIKDGTSLVEVEAISFDAPAGDRPVRETTAAAPEALPAPAAAVENQIYVQVGAFGSMENAQRRLAAIRAGGLGLSFVSEDTSQSPTLYRVRVGPIKSVEQYDLVVEELESLGIADPYLVTE
jgi:rare lipoprotein A